jgi:hypothetical protein
MPYLRYLCLCIEVSKAYCVVFLVLFVFVLCPVHSGVQTIVCCVYLLGLFSSCALCTQCSQFLWIVHS